MPLFDNIHRTLTIAREDFYSYFADEETEILKQLIVLTEIQFNAAPESEFLTTLLRDLLLAAVATPTTTTKDSSGVSTAMQMNILFFSS